jgi:hypothetical protein
VQVRVCTNSCYYWMSDYLRAHTFTFSQPPAPHERHVCASLIITKALCKSNHYQNAENAATLEQSHVPAERPPPGEQPGAHLHFQSDGALVGSAREAADTTHTLGPQVASKNVMHQRGLLQHPIRPYAWMQTSRLFSAAHPPYRTPPPPHTHTHTHIHTVSLCPSLLLCFLPSPPPSLSLSHPPSLYLSPPLFSLSLPARAHAGCASMAKSGGGGGAAKQQT